MNCKKICLWAIENKIQMYEHFKYQNHSNHWLTFSDEKFLLMHKEIVYLPEHETLGSPC